MPISARLSGSMAGLLAAGLVGVVGVCPVVAYVLAAGVVGVVGLSSAAVSSSAVVGARRWQPCPRLMGRIAFIDGGMPMCALRSNAG